MLEPYYNWRGLYVACEDPRSPFYGRTYSEFSFTEKIYNYYIHPQWDSIGSPTLFLKVLYADYQLGFAIIECLGEWNDVYENDGRILKRDFIDFLIDQGIDKFILIGENILTFHGSDDCYYQEWIDDIPDGWIVGINFRAQVVEEMNAYLTQQQILFLAHMQLSRWRTLKPTDLYMLIEQLVPKKISNRI